jgi:poly-gamma-glutamate synthesis protein (capsule biosynthesis protein)
MSPNPFLHKVAVLAGVIMILAGFGLAVIALSQLPTLPGLPHNALAAIIEAPKSPLAQPASPLAASASATASPIVSGPKQEIIVSMDDQLPTDLLSATTDFRNPQTAITVVPDGQAGVAVRFDWKADGGEPFFQQFFAAATRFDTIDLSLRTLNIKRAWGGDTNRFQSVAILSGTQPALTQLLGDPGRSVVAYRSIDDLVKAVWAGNSVLALVPFDQLQPKLAVYAVDGQIPIENSVKFTPSAYPLIATVYAHQQPGAPSDALSRLSAALPASNRDASRLTVVAMTGVTAMARFTAAAIDKNGPDWPAAVVGPELASADITAISDEVPFIPGCITNADRENLVFCSKPEYMATLKASGADIIGLTGNHLNDFGIKDSLQSLDIFRAEGLLVYGGGVNKQKAAAPLFLENNGNKLAFLGANSYGPESDWATDNTPGSARFDRSIMSAAIRSIKARGDADVVFAELQYLETDDVSPLADQRLDFEALAQAGADVVTGVQSHVPQAMEFVDGHVVLYGLGNLFFDQMWGEDTREGIIVKHTIYKGRLISTQLLPTLLFDYGQPRWPDPARRATILAKVFGASTWEN